MFLSEDTILAPIIILKECVGTCINLSNEGSFVISEGMKPFICYSVLCRCLKTFEVEFSTDNKEFSRINARDTIFTSYVFSPGNSSLKQELKPCQWAKPFSFVCLCDYDLLILYFMLCSVVDQEVCGLYRVRAVDYWGRPGSYSLPEKYSEEV